MHLYTYHCVFNMTRNHCHGKSTRPAPPRSQARKQPWCCAPPRRRAPHDNAPVLDPCPCPTPRDSAPPIVVTSSPAANLAPPEMAAFHSDQASLGATKPQSCRRPPACPCACTYS